MNACETDVTFEQPGPGGWKALADHFPGALTAEYQRIYAETCPPGMAAYMARYGVLARTLDIAYVHGHVYITPVPLAGPRETTRTPPQAAVWLLARLHPEFRKRTRAARWALAERPWREAAERWFADERTRWRDRAQRVEALDPSTLTDDVLIEHLCQVRRFVADGYRRHFELHGDDLLPIGLLLARAQVWGVDPAQTMRALEGVSSPVAPDGDEGAWQLATGYDLDNLTWAELGSRAGRAVGEQEAPFDLRPLVPAEHHEELDVLVADARAAVPLRDDNGVLTGAWPMGLLRRAMLEAGRRLDLAEPAVALEATVDELGARLAGGGEPSNAALLHRRTERRRLSGLAAPRTLGPEFNLPPLESLPEPLARIGAAQLAAADHMLEGPRPVGVGSERYCGRALVVSDPVEAMDLLEPGDVVVTQATSPAWNVLLAEAGAIVTTSGGLVSHAAVIARELGIPAVIGDPTAAARLTSGTMVSVDPVAATVTVSP